MTIHNLRDQLDWYLRTQPAFPDLDHLVADSSNESLAEGHIVIPPIARPQVELSWTAVIDLDDNDFGDDEEMARLQLPPITSARKSRMLSQVVATSRQTIATHLPSPVPSRSSEKTPSHAATRSPKPKPRAATQPKPAAVPLEEFTFDDTIDLEEIEEVDMMDGVDGLDDHTSSSATVEKFGEPRRLWREDSASRVEPLAKRGKKRSSDEFRSDILPTGSPRREKRGTRLISPRKPAKTSELFELPEFDFPDVDEPFSSPPHKSPSKTPHALPSIETDPSIKLNTLETRMSRLRESPSGRRLGSPKLPPKAETPRSTARAKIKLESPRKIGSGATLVDMAAEFDEPEPRLSKSVLVHESSPRKAEPSPSPQKPRIRSQEAPKATPELQQFPKLLPAQNFSDAGNPSSSQTRKDRMPAEGQKLVDKVLKMPLAAIENVSARLQSSRKKITAQRVSYIMDETEVPAEIEAEHKSISQSIKALESLVQLHKSHGIKFGQKEDIKKRLMVLMDLDEDDGSSSEITGLRKQIPPLNAELESIKLTIFSSLESSGLGTHLLSATGPPEYLTDGPSLRPMSPPAQPTRVLVASTQAEPKIPRPSERSLAVPKSTPYSKSTPHAGFTTPGQDHSLNISPPPRDRRTSAWDDSFQGFDDFSRNMGGFEIAEDFDVDDDIGLFEAAENQAPSPPRPARQPLRETSGNRNSHAMSPQLQNKNDPYADVSAESAQTDNQMQHPWSKDVKAKLKSVFKLHGFRRNQLEAINATLSGQDAFVLAPTGGGKSLCFCLPAVVQSGKTRGVTVVISPLLSLMQDQVGTLRHKGVQACLINGDVDQHQRKVIFEALRGPRVEELVNILYLTPEMVNKSQAMISVLDDLHKRRKLARFVIDEAHCISQWGASLFRPDYAALSVLRRQYPGVPLMALTATATENVKADIIRNLGMEGCQVFSQSFNRPNLSYTVIDKKRTITSEIIEMINTKHRNQCGIIYCQSRKACETLAENLRKNRIKAQHYHAGMESSLRKEVQRQWQDGECKVATATLAFGMGIDKSDVRFVAHHAIPKSLESLVQEVGRAGRDGKSSACYLFYGLGDTVILNKMISEGEGSQEQKQRQRDMLRNVVEFCENKSDCRRKVLLNYFNESFNERDCGGGCDVCLSNTVFVEHDFTDLAGTALALVAEIEDAKVTLLHCVDVFRGAKSRRMTNSGHDQIDDFGIGADLDRGDVERLFRRLLIEGGLKDHSVATGGGFSTAYVRTGPMLDDIISGARRVIIHVKSTSIPKLKALSQKLSKGRKRKATVAEEYPMSTNVSSPLQQNRKRPANRISGMPVVAEDSDADDFEPVSRKTRTRGSAPIRDNDLARLGDGHRVALEAFMEDAKKFCNSIVLSKSLKRPPFSDTVLRQMAIEFPSSVEQLANIPTINPDSVKRYGEQILKMVKVARANRDAIMEAQDFDHDPNHQNVIDISDDDFIVPDDSDHEYSEEDTSGYFSQPAPKSNIVANFNAELSKRQAESEAAAAAAAKRTSDAKSAKSQKSGSSYSGGKRGGANAWRGGGRAKTPRSDAEVKKKRAPAGRKGKGSSGGGNFFENGSTRGGRGGSRGGGGISMMPV